MVIRKRDNSLGRGVYFAPGDYVGTMRRIVILVVDLGVLLGMYLVLATLFMMISGELNTSFKLIYLLCVWAYLTILKASRIRTLGYRLTGSQIINLRGKKPSIVRMTFRLLLWSLGPFNLIFDLLWSSIDDDYQTLRDRFAGTCVVNNDAKPIGTAEIHLMYYDACGWALMYPRVMRPKRSA